jgi:hypothetical protein
MLGGWVWLKRWGGCVSAYTRIDCTGVARLLCCGMDCGCFQCCTWSPSTRNKKCFHPNHKGPWCLPSSINCVGNLHLCCASRNTCTGGEAAGFPA